MEEKEHKLKCSICKTEIESNEYRLNSPCPVRYICENCSVRLWKFITYRQEEIECFLKQGY